MPAKSKAQSRYLYAHFGADWVKRHGFDTPTAGLPQHVKKHKKGHHQNHVKGGH